MWVIAHRGASSYAPENTFPAFDLALQMGANGLETDIRTTRDGVLVLLHDATVDRTTDGHGPIYELLWADVQRLDAGSWFAPAFAGTRIPTLEAFLDRYAHRAHLALEIKALDIEAAVVQTLKDRDLSTSVTVTSFRWETIVAVRRLAPALHVGWLTRTFDEEAMERLVAIGAAQVCPPAALLTAELVALAKSKGLTVRAWGVSDEALMHRAIAAGADGITVNFPDKLVAALAS